MGVRLYAPQLGRFLQTDPVPGGGANTYSYPTDPVNSFDIDGKQWWRWSGYRRAYRWARGKWRRYHKWKARMQTRTLGLMARSYARHVSGGRYKCKKRYGMMTCEIPDWAYPRGGVTIGNTYLTGSRKEQLSRERIYHESRHRSQWRRYGASFAWRYFRAGRNACRNKWEQKANLRYGGYRC
jgi:hypothetical protein